MTNAVEKLRALELISEVIMDSFDGGRGIANRIETHFINPLAREFFFSGHKEDFCIEAVEERDGRTVLLIEGERSTRAPYQPDSVHPTHPVLVKRRPSIRRSIWRDDHARDLKN